MGGTPIGTSNPPCWGDCAPCPSPGRQWGTGVPRSSWGYPLPDTSSEMPCLGTDAQMGRDLPILWKESNVRELLNRLRAQEVTPHKLQLCWDTLRWFAKKFGLLAVQEEHRLLQKKKQTVETGLTPAVVQPARKARVPPKEVIWALEEGAAGVPLLPGAHSPQEKGAYAPRELDTFILGIVRYQVGCSARFNDLIRLPPWSSQRGRRRRSVLHGSGNIRCPWFVTDHAWWQPLLTWWTRLSKHPKDGMGFIARPGQADRTLRWLKDALGRLGVPPELFQDLTWHSFRVFIPDCAFQLGISRDQRRYLGNWMTESTADVYTREKRNVVVKVWHEVKPSPSKKSVKESLFSESLDEGLTVISPPKDQPPPVLEEDGSGEIQEVPPLPEEQDSTIPSKTPADKLGPPHGPLRVVASSRKSGPTGTYKIHLLTVDHKAVGCGWQPTALKAQDDHQSDPDSYQECVRCFKIFDFPSDWPVKQTAQEEDSEISSSSADSLTDDSVDTASESEKVTASDLRSSIPNDPLWEMISSGRGRLLMEKGDMKILRDPFTFGLGSCQMAPFGLAGYLVHLTGTILDWPRTFLVSFDTCQQARVAQTGTQTQKEKKYCCFVVNWWDFHFAWEAC